MKTNNISLLLISGVLINTSIFAQGENFVPSEKAPAQKSLAEKLPQTISEITFSPETLTLDEMITASASATSGLPVNFSSMTPLICRAMGENSKIIIPLDVGSCTIVANQAGDYNFAIAPTQSKTIKIDKSNQSISKIQFVPNSLTVKGATTAVATASSGLAIKFTSTTPSICIIEGPQGDTVTGVAGGTCTITAIQSGNTQYYPAAIQTNSLTVTKRDQTIGVINASAKTFAVNGTISVSAKATSGLPVVFSSNSPSICAVGGFEGDTVTGLAGGNCIIAANQSGNNAYSAAPLKTKTILVNKLAQTISNAINLTPPVAVGTISTISATTSSGLEVVFNSITPSTCAVLNNQITGVTAGSCTIIAAQAGNEQYKAAPPKGKTLTVAKGTNIIDAISFDPATLSIGTITTASATATSDLPVSFSSQTAAICTTSGTNGEIVTGAKVGNCTIAANQAGDTNWKPAAPVTKNITVNAAPPLSCLALKNSTPGVSSGVYKIDPDGAGGNAAFDVYCDMETDGGGWTMVYKIVSGSDVNPYDLLNSTSAVNESALDALSINTSFKNGYVNRYITNFWNTAGFSHTNARVHVYANEEIKKFLKFSTGSTDKISWFSRDHYIDSSWNDIVTNGQNFFSIVGDGRNYGRYFYINRDYGGCSVDAGWFVADMTRDVCSWESSHSNKPAILYSDTTTIQNWTSGNIGVGDVLAIFIR